MNIQKGKGKKKPEILEMVKSEERRNYHPELVPSTNRNVSGMMTLGCSNDDPLITINVITTPTCTL